MNDYCRVLLHAKRKFPAFGWTWIVVKILLMALAVAMLFVSQPEARIGGIFLLGWLLGSTATDVRNVLLAKRKWELQVQLYDWNKIEGLAKEP